MFVHCGPVFTRPGDLSDGMLASQLADSWGITADAVEYVAVGFGSHHWSIIEGERRWFVSVDDLDAKKRRVDDRRDVVFQRLRAALSAARVAADCGLDFVAAPIRAADDAVVARVNERYAAAVYPFLGGTCYPFGDFETVAHRDAVLGMVVRLHDVADPATTGALADDLVVPRRDDLTVAIGELGQRWDSGPYGELARDLLDHHASTVERLLERYDRIAAGVAQRPERMVLSHGEPHAANTVMTGDGWRLVDWDTTMIAAPERDLWMMAKADASVIDAYEAMTERTVIRDGLDCYRLWWDLSEICGYIALLHDAHDDTEDVRESWRNLQHFLNPTARLPHLA
jgi:spectinomycin phosphotransferase/16S rRNA (guanine(1405)-N(7))-methyltransferase